MIAQSRQDLAVFSEEVTKVQKHVIFLDIYFFTFILDISTVRLPLCVKKKNLHANK